MTKAYTKTFLFINYSANSKDRQIRVRLYLITERVREFRHSKNVEFFYNSIDGLKYNSLKRLFATTKRIVRKKLIYSQSSIRTKVMQQFIRFKFQMEIASLNT